MDITYAVIIKKEYQNILTTLTDTIYEIVDVYDSYELAIDSLKNTEGEALANLNKIDTNGMFKSYESKILTLEGKYDKSQVQSLANILKEKLFNNNKNKTI